MKNPILAWVACGTAIVWHAEAAVPVPRILISPAYSQLTPNQVEQFQAMVSGGGGAVVWEVNNVAGGTPATGTISQQGLYTDPATLPASGSVTVTASLASDATISATATITLAAAVASGRTYYVSPSGSDTASGTMAAPFLTIGHAAGLAEAGDTVFARQGSYNELLAPTHSGNATSGYITISAYPGEAAVLEGKGLPIPGGQAGLVTLNNESYVVIQGFEIRNYTSAKVNGVPIGIFVTGSGSNIQLINNHIHGITTTAPTTPAECQSNALGLAVYGNGETTPLSNLVISGNELNRLKTGCSESMSIDGNVDGFSITSNLVHDNDNIGIDAIGFERVSPNPALDQARDGEIRGNVVYNITSYKNPDYGRQYAADGIYVDGGTRITIEQNLVHDVDYGIELASEHDQHVTSAVIARNNVIYAGNAAGISIGGYAAKKGGTDQCSIVNNTLFSDSSKQGGAGELQIQFNATNNVFENNIVYAGKRGLLVNGYAPETSSPTFLDYNVYFTAGKPVNATWTIGGVTYSRYTPYRLATGQDARSVFADPLFQSMATPPMLGLQPGSPAIGAGVDLGPAIMGSVDFAGQMRVRDGKIDAGAFAHQ